MPQNEHPRFKGEEISYMTILARMLFLRFQRMTEATGVPEWNFSYPVLDIL